MLNFSAYQGRFCEDPILRYTRSQKRITAFALAVPRDGSEEGVDFIDCIAWENRAQFINEHFSKGQTAVVIGRTQTRTWKTEAGESRKAVELVISNIYFSGPAAGQNQEPASGGFVSADDFKDNPFEE